MDSLWRSSTTLHSQVGSRQRPNSYDFISQMPDDVLTKILSLMPIKNAMATSCVATRWRYLWHNLRQLNFDCSETFLNTLPCRVVESKREKLIKQVNSVIRSYNLLTVIEFRIRCVFNHKHGSVINDWLNFALKRKVEFLELDFSGLCRSINMCGEAYYFPSRVYTRVNPEYIREDVLMVSYLKKLILKRVNVTKQIFHNFLKNSPNLEMMSINDPFYLDHIIINGRGQCRNLKYFEIVDTCKRVKSIYLSDFDLVSFTFKGYNIDLRLDLLSKLKELDLNMYVLDINNVFRQISSCALSLESLSIAVKKPEGSLILEYVSMLPNVKKLRLAVGGRGYDCLLFVASVMNTCPKLETFTIEPRWIKPILRKKKARGVTNPRTHLKLVKIVEYKGRKCDFELAAYIIQTSVALKKVVITNVTDLHLRNKGAVRSSVESLKSIMPEGVELVIV